MFVDITGRTRIKLAIHVPMGNKSVDEITVDYLDSSFDAIAVTAPWQYLEGCDDGMIKILSGCEYSTGIISDEYEAYHIVGIGMTSDPEIPLSWKDMKKTARQKAAEMIKMIQMRNGFAFVAYPVHNGNNSESLLDLGEFDGIEIFNSEIEYGVSSDGYAGEIVDKLATFGARPTLIASNGEKCYEGEDFGCALMVEATDMESSSIVRALRQGHFYSTEGPEIHIEKVGADKVRVVCSPASRIKFFVGKDGGADHTVEGENLIEAEYTIKSGERYVRAEITDAEGLRAWSNIVSFDELYRN